MTVTDRLTDELRAEVRRLEDDLRTRVGTRPEIDASWREHHATALRCGRTGASWEEWSDDRVTQAAVAWVLATVFIRFAEDNQLVHPVWISGPKPRRAEALHAQADFLRTEARTNPDVTDREWLCQAISYLGRLPATRALVDDSSALWLVTPSGDAATRLLDYWRERDDSGELIRDLATPGLDTRFLGDLYQNLSEEARSRYALLQTPEFVEEFILDRTMEPALRERPLKGFALIDPTCGSGHFLLGAFARLLERWERQAPGMDSRARVQLALDSIHGVDLNPAAVAIARFRLTIAALRASGDTTLENAPAFTYHLAVGDSLLHGLDQGELDLGATFSADRAAAAYTYPTENLADLGAILGRRYDAVVGNPPYITVKDKALNQEYRRRYSCCKGTYALTVPFMERFFALATAEGRPGWVGQITSNSFMKREFGAPLIERFLPKRDLRLVCDTSGAYIPGHGTPTVILVGRNTAPTSDVVRAVLGIRGEPGRPENPAKGLVWSSIVEHVDDPGYSGDWVSVVDLARDRLSAHPWSLSGGGAVDLREVIERVPVRFSSLGTSGFRAITGMDEVFVYPLHMETRLNTSTKGYVAGEAIRDYSTIQNMLVIFPYINHSPTAPGLLKYWLWPWRATLDDRRRFGRPIREIPKTDWWELREYYPHRFDGDRIIVFSFVCTHNHFALDRTGIVANRSAPVVQLNAKATEDDHLALLGILNSSTACFWLKQNSHDKGSQGVNEGVKAEPWERFYEFTGTTLKDFPLPADLSPERGRELDRLAQRLAEVTPQAVADRGTPTWEGLAEAKREYDAIRAEMIAQQEELDWAVYQLYDLVDEDLTHQAAAAPSPATATSAAVPAVPADLPPLALGERAFEVVMARAGEETAWFDRHGSTPVTELPSHWPAAYRELVERRIELIGSHGYLRLLERPEYKRRWAGEPWERQRERAVRGWLLDRMEDRRFWFDRYGAPTPRSVAQLADEVSRDPELVGVLALWEGRPDLPVATSLERLLAREAVPFLAAYRYKDSGLRKRAAWEHTWALQRREDAGEEFGTGKANGPIPVPPRYTTADFRRKEYWDHRGKLDVPKERFIGYPGASRATDPSPVLGWAGWDHAQQAFALDQLVQRGEQEGWPDERLVPLVAGVAEVLPWVRQWHSEPDDFYGGDSPAGFFETVLADRCQQVERTPEQLAAWRPPAAVRARRSRKAATE